MDKIKALAKTFTLIQNYQILIMKKLGKIWLGGLMF